MKTFFKILILLGAIVLASVAIAIYVKTKVAPPVKIKYENQYLIDLEKAYTSIRSSDEAKKIDYLFIQTKNRISIYRDEEKISISESDNQYDNLINCYTPKFLNRCFALFKQSNWKSKDHAYMIIVMQRLLNVRHSNYTLALSRSQQDSLALIKKIISNYNEARSLSKRTSYTSIKNSKLKITQAEIYAKNEYLSNCTRLVNSLKKLKISIGNSHYNFVNNEIKKLAKYKHYTKDYYLNTLIPNIEYNISTYEKNAKSLYGYQKNVTLLRSRAILYIDSAIDYYNQKG